MKKLMCLTLIVILGLFAQTNEEIREMANEGRVEAQKVLAARYYYGFEGIEIDKYQAAYWFEKAANNGDAQAQYGIAYMYMQGEGYSQDSTKAFNWYKKSAEQGFLDSEVELGYCYFKGIGVESDFSKSADWYYKAAIRGNKIAQHSLGYLYMEGKGREKDSAEAIKWFKKAVAQEYEDSYLHLANLLYEAGDPSEYPEAVRLYQIMADKDNAKAQYKLGLMYLNGMGVVASNYSAFTWISKSAAQENTDAMYKLADMYDDGIGVAKDTAKAHEWRDAADAIEWDWMNWFWF